MDFITTYVNAMVSARELELRPRTRSTAHVARPRWSHRRRRRTRPPVDPVRQELGALLPSAALAVIDELARHADLVRIPAGRTILHRGHRPTQVVVVRAGRAVEHATHGPLTLSRGSRIGVADAVGGAPVGADVVAATDVDAVVIHAPAFLAAARSQVA